MELRSRVALALRWAAFGRVAAQIITWIITLVVIRLLEPADYGLMALSMMFIAFGAMLNELGLSEVIVQKAELSDSLLREILFLLLAVNLAFYVLFVGIAGPVAAFFNEPRVAEIMRVSALQFPIAVGGAIPHAMLVRNLDYKRKSIVEALAAIFGGLVSLASAYTGFGVWALVFGALTASMINAAGYWIASPYKHWPMFSFAESRGILKFGGLVSVERVVWYLYQQCDIFLVGKLLGKEALGVYSVAVHLASLPMQRINGIINQVGFSAFSRIQHDRVLVGSYLIKTVRIVSVFSFPVFFGISAVAQDIVAVLLGEGWSGAALPMQLLCLIMPIRMVQAINQQTVKALSRPDVCVSNILITFVSIVAALTFGSRWGITGICTAWITAYPCVFLIVSQRSGRITTVRTSRLLLAMLRPGIAACAMYGAVYVVKILAAADTNPIALLIVLVSIGALSFMGTLLLIDRKTCNEFLSFVRG